MNEHKITSLPKWAQAKINTLERRVEYWKEKNRQVIEGDTNVFQQDYLGKPPFRKPMEKDAHMIFAVPDTDFTVGIRQGQLQVSTEGRSSRLIVKPIAANLVQIEGWD